MNHFECLIQRFESRRNTRVLYNVYNSIQLSLCLQRPIKIWSVEISLSLKRFEIQSFFLLVILVTSDWSPTSWWSILESKFSLSLCPYVSFYIHMTKLMISFLLLLSVIFFFIECCSKFLSFATWKSNERVECMNCDLCKENKFVMYLTMNETFISSLEISMW